MQFRSPGLSSLSSSLATALLVIACNGDDTVTSATESSTTDATTTDTTADTTTASTTATTDDTTSMTTTATTTMTTTSTTETTAVSATETTTQGTTTTTTTTGESESDSDSDTTTGDPGEVVECGGEPLMVGDGVCTVAAPGTKGILLRGTVLAPDTTYNGGGVLVVDDVIVCVGCDCQDAPEAAEASRIDCAEGVISPGLINTHDHLGFANNVPIGEGPDRYEHRHDWRKGQNGHVKITTAGSANKRQIEAGELRFLLGGATSTIGGGAGRAGLLRNLDSNLKEGLTVATVDSDTFPLDDADGMQVEMGCMYGANPTEAADIADLDAYLPHIAEGINKAAHNEFICTSEGSGDVIEPQSGVVHAIALDASDVATMQGDRSKLVWSPRSNIVLYGNTAAVTAFDAIGVPIALGSDWVLSGSMNLLRELQCADFLNQNYYDHHFSDQELWRMVTTNAAFALGAEKAIGMLKPGYIADIAVFDGAVNKGFRAIVDGEPADVALVLRGGNALYGDAALMDDPALGKASCESLDVCGLGKKVCVQEEIVEAGLADIQAAINPVYPLFFCGVPDKEPTCTPSRPQYSGEITNDDGDGDGINDANDNCPLVFNPVRDFELLQGDFDMDGVGDVCDVCPLDGGDACEPADANDIDGDGVPNGSDNCPKEANPGQEDADSDGHGDLCDTCAEPNPGPAVCPLTIPALRDPNHPDHPGYGAPVKVAGVYVTAVRPDSGNARGFHVQDDSLAPYSGIFVFTATQSPGVQVGNRVSVSGVLTDYFGFAELTGPSVTIEDPGTDLPFMPIAIANPSELATGGPKAESHESMLVTVSDVTITQQNADANDYDEFAVTGNLRVDDQVYDNVINMGLNNSCPVGSQFTTLTGVLGYSFNNTKLWPRVKADIGFVMCDPAP